MLKKAKRKKLWRQIAPTAYSRSQQGVKTRQEAGLCRVRHVGCLHQGLILSRSAISVSIEKKYCAESWNELPQSTPHLYMLKKTKSKKTLAPNCKAAPKKLNTLHSRNKLNYEKVSKTLEIPTKQIVSDHFEVVTCTNLLTMIPYL